MHTRAHSPAESVHYGVLRAMLCPFCPQEEILLAKHIRAEHPDKDRVLNRYLHAESGKTKLLAGDCVFFVQPQENDAPIKVGHTAYLSKRVVSLQTGTPTALSTLLVLPGDAKTEGLVRKSFNDLHTRSGWYKADLDLLTFIHEMRGHIERHMSKDAAWWFSMLRVWFDRNPSKNQKTLDRAPIRVPLGVTLPKGFPRHDRELLSFYLTEVVPRRTPR